MVSISFTLARQTFELSDDHVRARLVSHCPGQINRYWVDVDGTRWPVKQALALATGLGSHKFQSRSACRLLAKLGFTVGPERTTPASPGAHKDPIRQSLPSDLAANVVLVSCVKGKHSAAAPARELYTSDYFAKMRRYAEATGRPWFILSAKHGLVPPDERLEPYDCYLSQTSREYRRVWGQRVREQLESRFGDLAGTVFEVHAGAAYVDAIAPELAAAGAVVIDKLHGQTIGQRLSWYLHQKQPIEVEAAEVLEVLQDYSRTWSLSEVLAAEGKRLRSPGVYSWWVDDDGARDLTAGLESDVLPGLIYLGLAGATRKGGRRSSNTLWGRIATMHLGKNHQFSTLRLSLGATLAHARGWRAIDERQLTLWMESHLRVIPHPVLNADILDALESKLLEKLDPPLNLKKVARTPQRERLSKLRKSYGGTAHRSEARQTDD